jgi:hypothetical protein
LSPEPDFRGLIGDELAPEEEARLRRTHDLLVAAGPPAELTPELEHAPVPGREPAPRVEGLPARRRGRVLALALGFAAAMLVVGYLFGARSEGFDTDYSVEMNATPAAPAADAVIDVGTEDETGNKPLQLKVRGLPRQPSGGYYELYLTRPGRTRATCGTFGVREGTTTVRLNAPYDFDTPHGWIVIAHRPSGEQSGPLLRVQFT